MKAKKVLAGALTCAMMLTMGMTAFAADGNVGGGMKKVYKLTNKDTVSPAETFHFTAECTGVTDAADGVTSGPALTIANADYALGAATVTGAEKTLAISHTEAFHSVGIYTYKITETVGTTAGVTYSTSEKTLVVTVTQGENGLEETYALHDGGAKTDTVVNEYSAGSLSVKKVVAGNLGDQNKKFKVTVEFKAPEGKNVEGNITYAVGEETKTITKDDWANGVATAEIELKHNQTITFTNIPYGVTYTVTENDYTGSDKYAAPTYEYSDTNKKIDSKLDTVEITNNKNDKDIDMGVNLTTLPYMLTIAGIVVIAAIAFVAKRRRFED